MEEEKPNEIKENKTSNKNYSDCSDEDNEDKRNNISFDKKENEIKKEEKCDIKNEEIKKEIPKKIEIKSTSDIIYYGTKAAIAAPAPVIAVPIPANEEKTPVIPREVIVAKVLPAVTAPMELWVAAAILPATIPVVPNPIAIGIIPNAPMIPPPIIAIVPILKGIFLIILFFKLLLYVHFLTKYFSFFCV